MSPVSEPRIIRFGVFEVDLRSGEVRREGRKVALQEKPFQVLAMLLEHPGEVVTREELQQRLWSGDVFVDFERGVNTAIKKVRLALDDTADNPRFVETLPKRGYRFIAPVAPVTVPAVPPASSTEPPRARRSSPRWVTLPAGLGIGLALLALAGRLWPPRNVFAGRSTLLVLPFQNLSGDVAEEYVSDGLTDEMIAQMGRLKPDRLGVFGRTTSMHYKGTALRADEIGRELGAEYLLSGSVRRSGSHVRVTAALVRAQDQVQLWTDTYDRQLNDLLRLQTEVAISIAGTIPLALSADDRARIALSAPVDPAAHLAYLRGLYYWNKFEPGAAPKAIEQYQRSIELAPGYAAAHAGLASAYTQLTVLGLAPPRDAYPKAKAAAAEALRIDPRLADAHNPLGWGALAYDWDFPAAEREFRNAIALDPNAAEGYHGLGMYQAAMGRTDEALSTMRRALDLDPLSLHINHKLCVILYWARRYDAAIDQCRKTIDLDPRYALGHWTLAHVYDAKGLHDQAQDEYFLSEEYMGGDMGNLERERVELRTRGWKAMLREGVEGWSAALESAKDPGEAEAVAVIVASQWARLGEKEKALAWLERSYPSHDFLLAFLGVDPLFDPLRAEPRFQALIRKIGLPAPGVPRA
jgi:TolB-like protein/DNA-binding winged helix-turn-helix (wHTH) protein/Flp pilus assembly protein TadD